jgi:hypothetical protein
MSWAERPVGMEAPGHDIRGGELEAVLDQISLLTASLGTIVNRTTNQSIPNGAFTTITFPTVEADNMSNFVSGSSAITVSRTGMYNIQFGAVCDAAAGGIRSVIVRRNSVEVPASGDTKAGDGGNNGRLAATSGVACNAGDTIDIQVFQSATGGGAINFGQARLAVFWMGDLS